MDSSQTCYPSRNPSFPYQPPLDDETGPRMRQMLTSTLPSLRSTASFPPYREGVPTPSNGPQPTPGSADKPHQFHPYPTSQQSRRSSSVSEREGTETSQSGSTRKRSPKVEVQFGKTARQLAHVVSEQKRRESINRGFEDLRQLVPSSRGTTEPKSVVLRKASWWIIQLQEENTRLKNQLLSLTGSQPGSLTSSERTLVSPTDSCPTCFRPMDFNREVPREFIDLTNDYPQTTTSDPSSPMSVQSSQDNQSLHFERRVSEGSLTGSFGYHSRQSIDGIEIDELDSDHEREILAFTQHQGERLVMMDRPRPRRIWEE